MSKFKPGDKVIRVGKVYPSDRVSGMEEGNIYTVVAVEDNNLSFVGVPYYWVSDFFALADKNPSNGGWRDITQADLITLGNILPASDYEVRIQVRVKGGSND